MILRSLTLLIVVLGLTACGDELTREFVETKYTNDASRFMELADGNRIHYRVEGEGTPILLIHGTASSLHTWDGWTEILQADHQIIRLDLPGFGLTGPDPMARYEVKDDVKVIHQFVTALEIDKFHIAGSSLGGRIAWEYSLEHTDDVLSLTLMNSLGYPQESWPPAIQLAQWPVFDSIISSFAPRFVYAHGLKDVYADANIVTPELVDRYYHLANFPGNLAAFPDRVKAKLDTESAKIPSISVPTLVLWGKEDKYFPAQRAADFGRDIKNSTLVIYDNIGHLPMEEITEKSATDFAQFVGAVDKSAY